ncbi:MAG: SPFH domain-containing protein, partial [Nanoarchaeota archaeon]
MDNIKDLLNGIAKGITFATGIGFIQYARGKWPFTEVPDNEYHLTQWFNEKKGPVLKGPDTVWFISPLIKRVIDENKKVIAIPQRGQQRDIKDLEYLAEDGISGKIDMQYRWQILSKEDAYKFYWEVEGKDGIEDEIEGRIAQVDEVLAGRLKEKISHRSGIPENLVERDYLNKLALELNGFKLLRQDEQVEADENEEKIGDYRVVKLDDKDTGQIYTIFGIAITNINVLNPRPDQASLEILQAPF